MYEWLKCYGASDSKEDWGEIDETDAWNSWVRSFQQDTDIGPSRGHTGVQPRTCSCHDNRRHTNQTRTLQPHTTRIHVIVELHFRLYFTQTR